MQGQPLKHWVEELAATDDKQADQAFQVLIRPDAAVTKDIEAALAALPEGLQRQRVQRVIAVRNGVSMFGCYKQLSHKFTRGNKRWTKVTSKLVEGALEIKERKVTWWFKHTIMVETDGKMIQEPKQVYEMFAPPEGFSPLVREDREIKLIFLRAREQGGYFPDKDNPRIRLHPTLQGFEITLLCSDGSTDGQSVFGPPRAPIVLAKVEPKVMPEQVEPLFSLNFDTEESLKQIPGAALNNVKIVDGALYLNGRYGGPGGPPDGYTAVFSHKQFNYTGFTVAFDFNAETFEAKNLRSLVTGGEACHWLHILREHDGTLTLTFNASDDVFPIPGATVQSNRWYHLVCVANSAKSSVVLWLNGTRLAQVVLPDDFRWTVAGTRFEESDRCITFTDYGSGMLFQGKIDNVNIYNRAISDQDVHKLWEKSRTKAQPATATGAAPTEF